MMSRTGTIDDVTDNQYSKKFLCLPIITNQGINSNHHSSSSAFVACSILHGLERINAHDATALHRYIMLYRYTT
jgi:hypothetical protein